jgi:hypothetical protein
MLSEFEFDRVFYFFRAVNSGALDEVETHKRAPPLFTRRFFSARRVAGAASFP